MTRVNDISGRVNVFHCGSSGGLAGNAGATTFGPAAAAGLTTTQIDRTGYGSYILHAVIVADSGMTVGETLALTALKLQSYNDDPNDAATATWQDVTSVTTTAVNYKPLYLNRTGVISGASNATSNIVPMPGVAGTALSTLTTASATEAQVDAIIPVGSGCFTDQPYTWTALGTPAKTVVIDARIFGTFRSFDSPAGVNYGVVGAKVAPYMTVTPGAGAGHTWSAFLELILGAGDTMPVIRDANPLTGWGGTGTFYSQGP